MADLAARGRCGPPAAQGRLTARRALGLWYDHKRDAWPALQIGLEGGSQPIIRLVCGLGGQLEDLAKVIRAWVSGSDGVCRARLASASR